MPISVLVVTAELLAQCEIHEFEGDPEPPNTFGASVAIAADVVAVGNPRLSDYPGSVSIFRYDGFNWVEEAELTLPVVSVKSFFGLDLAFDSEGDVLVVGDALADGPLQETGLAFVYRLDKEGWQLEATLAAPDASTGDFFGEPISIYNDTIAVGARTDKVGVWPDAGSAHVFRLIDGVWQHETQLLEPRPFADHLFGRGLAVYADSIVVGAPGFNLSDGRAYVFSFHEGRWSLEEELIPSGATNQERFGWSADLVGDVAVVGATKHGGAAAPGAVYVFRRDTHGWVQEALLEPEVVVGLSPEFGDVVSLSTTTDALLVAAPHENGMGSSSGTAFLFRRDESGWGEDAKIYPSDSGPGQNFGSDLRIEADRAVIGAFDSAYVLAGVAGIDCNSNGESDSCDIHKGSSQDADGDGVPDECHFAGDVDGNGVVDVADLILVVLSWGDCADDCSECIGDANADCVVDVDDLLAILLSWS